MVSAFAGVFSYAANAEDRSQVEGCAGMVSLMILLSHTTFRDILGFNLAHTPSLWPAHPQRQQEPGAVYRCFEEAVRCPGGEPGTCSFGRDWWET